MKKIILTLIGLALFAAGQTRAGVVSLRKTVDPTVLAQQLQASTGYNFEVPTAKPNQAVQGLVTCENGWTFVYVYEKPSDLPNDVSASTATFDTSLQSQIQNVIANYVP